MRNDLEILAEDQGDNQNTHGTEVTVTVKNSVLALKRRYPWVDSDNAMNSILMHICNYRCSDFFKNAVLRCLTVIEHVNTIHAATDLTLRECLALVWEGINDKTCPPAEVRVITDSYVELRKESLLEKLYDAATTYPHMMDSQSCFTGTFNKIVESLNHAHFDVNVVVGSSAVLTSATSMACSLAWLELEALPHKEQRIILREWDSEALDSSADKFRASLEGAINEKLINHFEELLTEGQRLGIVENLEFLPKPEGYQNFENLVEKLKATKLGDFSAPNRTNYFNELVEKAEALLLRSDNSVEEGYSELQAMASAFEKKERVYLVCQALAENTLAADLASRQRVVDDLFFQVDKLYKHDLYNADEKLLGVERLIKALADMDKVFLSLPKYVGKKHSIIDVLYKGGMDQLNENSCELATILEALKGFDEIQNKLKEKPKCYYENRIDFVNHIENLIRDIYETPSRQLDLELGEVRQLVERLNILDEIHFKLSDISIKPFTKFRVLQLESLQARAQSMRSCPSAVSIAEMEFLLREIIVFKRIDCICAPYLSQKAFVPARGSRDLLLAEMKRLADSAYLSRNPVGNAVTVLKGKYNIKDLVKIDRLNNEIDLKLNYCARSWVLRGVIKRIKESLSGSCSAYRLSLLENDSLNLRLPSLGKVLHNSTYFKDVDESLCQIENIKEQYNGLNKQRLREINRLEEKAREAAFDFLFPKSAEVEVGFWIFSSDLRTISSEIKQQLQIYANQDRLSKMSLASTGVAATGGALCLTLFAVTKVAEMASFAALIAVAWPVVIALTGVGVVGAIGVSIYARVKEHYSDQSEMNRLAV